MLTCDNCRAKVPALKAFFGGKMICCIHCIFSPQGCRCGYGQYGEAETFVDSEPDEDYDYSEPEWDEHEGFVQCECGAWNEEENYFCDQCRHEI